MRLSTIERFIIQMERICFLTIWVLQLWRGLAQQVIVIIAFSSFLYGFCAT